MKHKKDLRGTTEENRTKKRPKKSFELTAIHKKLAKEIGERLGEHGIQAHRYYPGDAKIEMVIDIKPTEHVHVRIDFSDVRGVSQANSHSMEFINFSIVSNCMYDSKRSPELVEFVNLVNSVSKWERMWLDKTSPAMFIECSVPFQSFGTVCAGQIVVALLEEFSFWTDKAKMVDAGMSVQDAFDAA